MTGVQTCALPIFCHLPDDPRHFRLPQYVFYVDDVQRLVKPPGFDAGAALRAKTKFANFVVSNPRCPERNRFFRQLHRRRHVDSGGRHFNNLGRPIADKLAFIRDYKFTLAFENSASDGYTTEKLVEPMLAGSVPIYWGNPLVGLDFNPRSFIDVSAFPDFDAAIEGTMRSAFANCGQVCLGTERVYVQRPIFDKFVAELKKQVEGWKIGVPEDADVKLGPVISKA